MAWKCSLELTHVYNIYCGNTPSRAPQLRRSIRSHMPLWVCETHPEGRGSIWVDLLFSKKFGNSKIRSTPCILYDARYRRITPPTDPARRNIGTPHYLSDLYPSVCLSVSSFLLLTFLSESFRVRTRTRRRTVRDTWIFISVSPCPVARKYFLGSPLIYHNRDVCPPDQNFERRGQSRPFARRAIARDRARVRNQLRP